MAGWMLDASAIAIGERYEAHVVPSFHAAWADEIARRLAIRPGDRVLDVACGTGALARRAAARVGAGGEVVALDASPAMLLVAERASRAARVRWRGGDAHALPFPDASFDRVACPHGLVFFDEPARALAEMARVLKPGGRLVATAWAERASNPHEAALADAFREATGGEPPFFATLFSLSAPGALARLAGEAGLASRARVERVTREARFDGFSTYWRGMACGRPVSEVVDALPTRVGQRLAEAARARLAPWAVGRGYRSPQTSWFLSIDGGA